MADSEHSSSDDSFSDSQATEKSRQEPELQFSEDEEALIIRMYNLVGERLVLLLLL
ncbi:hypothetical protein PRUPE_4G025800 [Prunus persica]|uniref:Uncharacterized protein n=1 Tax=Prunus persica TaxID=3760 RepID=A0A251PEP3_PRUPE|nr:hypothetical protein PRUPE_4G025800 [Prunus persica]